MSKAGDASGVVEVVVLIRLRDLGVAGDPDEALKRLIIGGVLNLSDDLSLIFGVEDISIVSVRASVCFSKVSAL